MGDSTADHGQPGHPAPEPARRGLVNAATDVAAATNQAVAAAAHLQPTEQCAARGADGLGVSAEPPRNAKFQSIIRTEEVDHDEPNASAANGGGIAAELRNWARGCHSTEAAVELLIKACGGRFVDPGQPWLRTDDRGNHLARRAGHSAVLACCLLRRTPHSGPRRSPRNWQAARRCRRPHGQLEPLPSRSRPCRLAACRL